MKDVLLYDTTLRDGCQAEDISLTLEDKLRMAAKLDDMGIDYIEGGYPGSNPRDADFFKQVKKLKLKNAKVASFGTTRKFGAKPSQDINLKALLGADAPAVTLVGKTWDLHVRDDLRISQKANLEIIADSIAFMKKRVDEVIFDAEHFFDGFRANPDYALECLKAAQEGGADWIVLCETNGGSAAGRYSRRPRASEPGRSRRRWAFTATTTASWRLPTRWPPWRWARLRCRARSTASASAAATSI